MGRDLSYKIIYNKDSRDEDWTDVPYASRNNEVLGYISHEFTKGDLEVYIGKLIKEYTSYDYNMNDIANAISCLEFIYNKLHSCNWSVIIKYA
jgi:hypothetical protein